jgi:hypothetical protein
VPNGAVEERGRLIAYPHQARRKKADGDRMDRCVFFLSALSLITAESSTCNLVFLPLMKNKYSCCQATHFKLEDQQSSVFNLYANKYRSGN